MPGHVARFGMCGERPATALRSGPEDFTAVRLEHANPGAMKLAERDVCDAAGKERDAVTSSVNEPPSSLYNEEAQICPRGCLNLSRVVYSVGP
jgi:hypothetical protein